MNMLIAVHSYKQIDWGTNPTVGQIWSNKKIKLNDREREGEQERVHFSGKNY